MLRSTRPNPALTRYAGLIGVSLWLTLANAAFAQNAPGGMSPPGQSGNGAPPDNMMHKGPPPEAIAACQNKTAGNSCSFTGRRGENLTGSCFQPPARPEGPGAAPSQGNGNAQQKGGKESPPLACRPANTPDHKGQGQGQGNGNGNGRS